MHWTVAVPTLLGLAVFAAIVVADVKRRKKARIQSALRSRTHFIRSRS